VDSGVVLLVWSDKHDVSVRVSIKLPIPIMEVGFIELHTTLGKASKLDG